MKSLMERVAQKYANGDRITITVDFSCLDKKKQPDMAALIQWQENGLVQMSGAEEIIKEFERANPNVRERLEEQYLCIDPLLRQKPAIFNMVGFNEATFDGEGTTRNGKRIDYYFEKFKNAMFPDFGTLEARVNENALCDVWHVSTHYIFGRDIFLALDKHFVPEKLSKKFPDLIILTPTECVNILQGMFRSSKKELGHDETT